MSRIAKVAVDLSLDREFDYLIPEPLRPLVEIGSRVEVPFRSRMVTGFVVGFADKSAFDDLKPIGKVLGEKSLVNETVMELARWMSAYYLTPFETCVRAVLPAVVRNKANGEKKQLTVSLTGAAPDKALTEVQQKIFQCLETSGEMLLSELTTAAGCTAAPVKTLEKKGLVTISNESVYRDPHEGVELLKTDPLPLMEMSQFTAIRTRASNCSRPIRFR